MKCKRNHAFKLPYWKAFQPNNFCPFLIHLCQCSAILSCKPIKHITQWFVPFILQAGPLLQEMAEVITRRLRRSQKMKCRWCLSKFSTVLPLSLQIDSYSLKLEAHWNIRITQLCLPSTRPQCQQEFILQ